LGKGVVEEVDFGNDGGRRLKKIVLSTLISVLLLSAMSQAIPIKPEMTKTVKAVESSDFVYLSDMEWEHAFFAHNASYEVYQGEPCSEPSVWKDRNKWGGRIELHSVVYEKGICIRPTSSLRYRLDGNFTVFETDLGLYDDSSNTFRWAGFDLYGDDVLLYSSPEIRVDTPALRIRVPLNGVNALKLNVVTDCYANDVFLADAKLYYNMPLEKLEEYYVMQPNEWFIEMRRPVNVWTQNESMKITVMNGEAAKERPLLKYRFSSSELLIVGQRTVAMKTDGENLLGEVEVVLPKLNGIYEAEFELEYRGEPVANKELVFGVISERASSTGNEDSIFGMNLPYFLYEGWRLSRYIRQIGVKWVRYWFPWLAIEPTNDTFDFSLTDELISEIRAQNLSIVGVLGNGANPRWACKTVSGMPQRYPPRINDWVDYVSHVVERYKDKIKVWQFWNEPEMGNHDWNYTCYEELLKATYDTIKAIDPEAKLIQGVWKPAGGNEVIFKDGFGDYFEGLVRHPYRDPYAPEDRIYIDKTMNWTTFQEDVLNDYALTQKYGGGKEIWLTEIAWWGSSSDLGQGPGNTVQEQSEYLARAYVLALSTGLKPKLFYHAGPWGPIHGWMNNEWGFPFPTLIAYANVANQLEGTEYVKTLEISDDNIFAYLFETNSTDVYVLWTAKHDRWISVTGDIDRVGVLDKFGNPYPAIKQANQFSLLLQGSPIFLRTEKGSNLTFQVATEPLSLIKRSQGYETNLADGFRSLKSIIVDSSKIYVAEAIINGSIYFLTVDGKDIRVLVENLKLPNALAIDAKSLYWGEFGTERFGDMSTAELKKIILATSKIVNLACPLDMPWQHTDGVYSIALSPSYVYYLSESRGIPARVPTNGGPIEYLYNGTVSRDGWLPLRAIGQAHAILATESRLYWDVGYDIYTRLTADDGLVTKLTDFQESQGSWSSKYIDHIPSMVMDSQYIYFVHILGGFVRKVPLTGGDMMTLAQGLDYPNSIAIDSDYIYWSELGFHSAGGSIKRMPKNGGAITTLIDGMGEVGGIALDNEYVYWTEGDSVKKIAKNATAPSFSPTISVNRTETLLGHAIAITGQLNSTVEVSNVTLEYSLDKGQTWSFVAQLSTDPEGKFSCDWKPLKEGKYLVRAVWAPSVRYQEVVAESVFIDVAVGDLNKDGSVDIYDAIILANAYGSAPTSSNWNAAADINSDNNVDIYDAIMLANNYGKTA
jgi:hypothetical protein